MNKLQLYVWQKFCPSYTNGLAFAIAESEQEAKALVEKAHYVEVSADEWGPMTILPLTPIAFSVNGGD